MKNAQALCVALIILTSIHFAIAIVDVGLHRGAGLDVFLAGYLADPWQAVINADLMAGLFLAAAWIAWRERDPLRALSWVLVLLWWGNLILAMYAYRALDRSGGSWARFFLGTRAADALPESAVAMTATKRGVWYAAAAAVGTLTLVLCWRAEFALIPSIGYLGGIACFIPGLLVAARR